MKRFVINTVAVTLLALGSSACSQKFMHRITTIKGDQCRAGECIIEANYDAADTISGALKDKFLPTDGILVTDFVNIDQRQEVATLGRMIPEQISARLAQNGFSPVTLHERTRNPESEAVLVGTYTSTMGAVFVNARIIRVEDSKVLAGCDYALPVSPNTRGLVPGPWNNNAPLEPTVKTSFVPVNYYTKPAPPVVLRSPGGLPLEPGTTAQPLPEAQSQAPQPPQTDATPQAETPQAETPQAEAPQAETPLAQPPAQTPQPADPQAQAPTTRPGPAIQLPAQPGPEGQPSPGAAAPAAPEAQTAAELPASFQSAGQAPGQNPGG